MVPRILATLVAIGLFIGLMCTDLDSGQRWLVVGMIWAIAIANWDRT